MAETQPDHPSKEKDHPVHILVLEAGEVHARHIRRSFSRFPEEYRLTFAHRLSEARPVMKNDPPDLIIAAWLLPDGNGMEILPRINGMVTTPLIILSGHGDEKLAVETMKSGAIDYIVKSERTFHELPRIVDRALREWNDIRERKRAEEELRKSESKFRAIYETSPYGIALVDREGHVLASNPALERMLGYTKEELHLKHFSDYTYPDDTPVEQNLIQQVLDGQIDHYALEKRYIRKDGRIIWALLTGSLLDEQLRPAYGLAMVEDITERKTTQNEIEESEQKYRGVFSAESDAIFLIDRDSGSIVDVNEAACRLYGFSREELLHLKGTDVSAEPEESVKSIRELLPDPLRYHKKRDGTIFPVEVSVSSFSFKGRRIVVSVARDISQQRHLQDLLIAEKDRAKNLIDIAGVIILALDSDGAVTLINKKGCDILGYTKEEIIGKNWTDTFLPERVRDQTKEVFNALLSGRLADVGHYENPLMTSRGEERIISWNNTDIRDKSGKIIGTLSSGEDVTERKRAEKALREANSYNRSLIEASLDPLVTIGPDGKITDVNKATEEVTGYSRDRLIGTDFSDYFNEPEKARAGYRKVFDEGFVRDYPLELHHVNGMVTSVLYNASVYRDPSGQVIGVFAAARDVTERKRVEQELTTRNAILAVQNDVAIDGILAVDENQKILLYNHRFLEMWQIPPELGTAGDDEPLLGHVVGLVKDPPSFLSKVRSLYEHRDMKGRDEIALADGRFFDRYSAPMFGPENKYFGRIWYFRDISDQKKSEAILRENEVRLAKAMKIAQIVDWEFDPATGRFRFNDDFYALFGTTAEREGGYLMLPEVYAREFVHPDDAPLVAEEIKKALSTRDPEFNGQVEHRIYRRDGELRYVAVHYRVVLDTSGKVIGTRGINQDITERKIAEIALRDKEERLAKAMDLAKLVSWEFDVATRTYTFDDRFYALYGTTARQEGGYHMHMDEYLRTFVYPDDASLVDEAIGKSVFVSDPHFDGQIEHRIVRRDGEIRYILVHYSIVTGADGRHIKSRGVNQDITERKRSEEAIQKSEEQYRSLVETTGTGYVIVDEQGRVITANMEYLRLTGRSSLKELLGRPVTDWTAPYDIERNAREVGLCFSKGHVKGLEIDYQKPDGTIQPVEINASVIGSGTGKIILTLVRDITERKHTEMALRQKHEELNAAYEQLAGAEEGLRESYDELEQSQKAISESEGRYRNLFENMMEGFAYCRMIYDEVGEPVDFIYLNVNRAFNRIVGTETVIGKRVTELFPGIREAMPQIFNIYGRVAKNGIPESFDLDFTFSAKWLHLSVYSPEPGYFVAVFEDITGHKFDEDVMNLSSEVLQLSYRHTSLPQLLDVYVSIIRKYTGCDAVGIRLLDEEGNIPYVAYAGFTRDFYETESPLSIKSDLCMCINVIKGTTDPGLPFYSEGGSFYMNGTTKFLSTVSEEDKGKTRNVCNKVGYESVALIPIREHTRIAGLIHLADARDDKVPLRIVEVLEKVATPIGEVVKRLQVEADLRQSEEKYRSLVENVIDVFYRTDQQGMLTFVSPHALPLLGYGSYSEVLNRPIEAYWKDPDSRAGMIERMKKDGYVRDYEVVIVGKDKREIPVSVSSAFYRDKNGEIAGVEGVIRDISERKKAEAAIREAEEKFRTIFDTYLDALVVFEITASGMPGKIIDVNAAACTQLGYTKVELQAKSFFEINADEYWEAALNQIAGLYLRGYGSYDSVRIKKDGVRFPVEVQVHRMKLQGRDVIVSSARDVSERRRQEKSLKISNQKLHLMNIVAWHDIQNKITGLRGYVELTKDIVTDEKAKGFVRTEEEVLKVIDQQIQYTKEYQQMGVAPPQWLRINEVLRRVFANQNAGSLDTAIDVGDLEIFCDPTVEKAFSYLVGYTLDPSRHADLVRIYLQKNASGLILCYDDNGTGIPTDKKKEIFQRDVAKFSGFGMFFIHDILDISEMSIKETGDPEKGVRFEITIPKGAFRFSEKQ